MEKIGDYIPLIIIALSFIYSIVRKAGKKAGDLNKTTLPDGLPQRNTATARQVKPQSVPTVQLQAVPYTQVKKKKQPEISASFSNSEVSTVFSNNERQSSMSVGEITDDTGISLDFSDMDEVKKGIIYSEIFNRKH